MAGSRFGSWGRKKGAKAAKDLLQDAGSEDGAAAAEEGQNTDSKEDTNGKGVSRRLSVVGAGLLRAGSFVGNVVKNGADRLSEKGNKLKGEREEHNRDQARKDKIKEATPQIIAYMQHYNFIKDRLVKDLEAIGLTEENLEISIRSLERKNRAVELQSEEVTISLFPQSSCTASIKFFTNKLEADLNIASDKFKVVLEPLLYEAARKVIRTLPEDKGSLPVDFFKKFKFDIKLKENVSKILSANVPNYNSNNGQIILDGTSYDKEFITYEIPSVTTENQKELDRLKPLVEQSLQSLFYDDGEPYVKQIDSSREPISLRFLPRGEIEVFKTTSDNGSQKETVITHFPKMILDLELKDRDVLFLSLAALRPDLKINDKNSLIGRCSYMLGHILGTKDKPQDYAEYEGPTRKIYFDKIAYDTKERTFSIKLIKITEKKEELCFHLDAGSLAAFMSYAQGKSSVTNLDVLKYLKVCIDSSYGYRPKPDSILELESLISFKDEELLEANKKQEQKQEVVIGTNSDNGPNSSHSSPKNAGAQASVSTDMTTYEMGSPNPFHSSGPVFSEDALGSLGGGSDDTIKQGGADVESGDDKNYIQVEGNEDNFYQEESKGDYTKVIQRGASSSSLSSTEFRTKSNDNSRGLAFSEEILNNLSALQVGKKSSDNYLDGGGNDVVVSQQPPPEEWLVELGGGASSPLPSPPPPSPPVGGPRTLVDNPITLPDSKVFLSTS